jgi:hypothetical protein
MKWLQRKNADLDRELAADLELEEEEQRAAGLPAEEARYAARRAFGNTTLIKEQTREVWGWTGFERLLRDVRYALRQLRRSPASRSQPSSPWRWASARPHRCSAWSMRCCSSRSPFAIPIALSSCVRPSSRRGAQRSIRNSRQLPPLSAPEERCVDARRRGDLCAARKERLGRAEIIPASWALWIASPEHFSRARRAAHAGPGLRGRAMPAKPPRAVILSYEGWQEFFARDPAVIGKDAADRRPSGHGHRSAAAGHAVSADRIGAEACHFQETADNALLFEPLAPSPRDLSADMGNFNYKVIARLKPGVSLSQANAELEACRRPTRFLRICPFISESR